MSARRSALIALTCALALLASGAGCLSAFERKPPQKQRFMFQLPEPAPEGAQIASVLRVARVRVSPVFDNKGFVYRTGESSFETDFYNEFFSPPGVLLRESLAQWLASSNLFTSLDRGSAPEADWVLETDVEQLFVDQRKPSAPQAFLALGFRLLDARSGALKFEQRYSGTETAAGASAAQLVEAWNRALGAVLRELARDLRAALTTRTDAAERPPARTR